LGCFFSKKNFFHFNKKPLDRFLRACYGLGIVFIPTEEGLMQIIYSPAIGMFTRGNFTAV